MNIFTKFGKGKTLLLTLLFALMSGSAWAYGFQKSFAEEIDGVTYYYDMWFNITDAENHYVEVTYKNTNYNSYNSMRIAIPKTVTYNDVTYTVTAIGADAFRNCTVLQYIYLSDVTSIGDNAFYGCTGLVNLTLTTGIKTIGSNAFDGCTGLTSVTIPPQMTSIGLSAFRGCTNLTSVYYNATDCTTGSYIFNDCTSDCTLTIGNDVPGIPNMAFYYFPGLKTINFGTHANFYIGDGAFTSCTGLTSVVIPDNVTSIRSYAFNGCTALTEVTIGNGITSIGDNAFTGCNNITNVYFNATNCPDAGISSTSTLWTMNGNNDCTVHVGNNVTRIPQNLFHGFTKIKNVDFGSNPILTVIGSNAFSGTGLTSVTIPNSVTTIGSSAFSGCSSLVSLDLGSVQTIETLAFFNCTGLTTLTIPASVSTIEAASWEGNGAFWSCTGLTEIWFMGATAPTITNRAVFADVPTTIPVYVPKGYPTTGAYSYFNNYKPYLRFVGGNSGDNWTVASNWTGACTDVDNDIYVHAVPANDEVVVIDGSNDPWIPDDYVAQPYKVILKDGRKIKIDNDGRLITDQALQVEVEKEIEQWTTDPVGGWYFIASPINTILHPNDVGNMVTDDDASGHTFDLYSYDATNGEVEFAGVVERDGRKRHSSVRPAELRIDAVEQLEAFRCELAPLGLKVLFLDRPLALALCVADVREVRHGRHEPALHVAVARAAAPYRALHVALSGGEPHFADEDVLYFDRLLYGVEEEAWLKLADLHRAAFLGSLHRVELDFPVAARPYFGGLLLPGEFNHDQASRNAGLNEAEAGVKIAGRNINNLSFHPS